MNLIIAWLFAYLLPWVLGILTIRRTKKEKRKYAIHLLLIASIITSSAASIAYGKGIPGITILGIITLCIGIIFSTIALKKMGVFYSISSFLQEATLLMGFWLLQGAVGTITGTALVVMPFVLSHVRQKKDWKDKVPLTIILGVASILLFTWLHDPLLNAGLHAILGSAFIKKGIFYRQTKNKY